MPLMIKLNRNIMKVYLCLDNGHFITVDISNEKLGIWIQRKNMFGNKMAVAVLNNSDNVTNDDLKEQFIKYSKVFDDSLTNKEIDEYWDKMLKGKNRGKKLKNIKVKRIIFYGKVIYLILEGKI